MKRAVIFAAALMMGLTFAGQTSGVQAATVNTNTIKKVVMADGGTLKECLESLEKQQLGNCVVITLPCNPGAGQKPETPDNKPETPDNSTPENKPETPDSKPETPDDSKPETPDDSTTETPDNNAPDNSAPENKPETPDNSVPENKPEMPDNSALENKPGQEEGAETEYHAYVLRVVELVNEERAKAGLNPVTLRKNISAAAQMRAQETEVSFSHTRPDGTKFTTALAQAGVTYRGAGENIAWGQRTPEQVMNGWMNSAGHRANILNEKFTSIGVGYYQNAAGTNYWTQLFTY